MAPTAPRRSPDGDRARTPLIAGNWKMHKTEAQAEEYIQALLPRVASVERRGGGDLRALHRPARDGRQRARLARGGVRAEHAPRARGRLHRRGLARRCSASWTCAASCSATPSAAQLFGETDKALALKVPGGARRPGCADPVRGGERGRARQRRHRAQAAPAGQGRPRGRSRRAPGRCGDRVRADLGDRHRQGRHARAGAGGDRVHQGARGRSRRRRRPSACGSSTAARSSPRTPPSCWRCPMSTARSWAAPRSRPSPSRRSSPAATP